MKRTLVLMVVLGVAASWLTGCSSPKRTGAGQAATSDVATAHGEAAPGGSPHSGMMGETPVEGMPESGSPTAAGGLGWTLPPGWNVEPPRSMRVATYAIPAAAGDTEGAQCAVYHFGAGQGGGVDANLQRWTGEFQPATRSKRSARKVGDIQVTLADVSGTYTAHGGSMTQPQGDKPEWRLLGAIAEGPEGAVFFKLTGPAKTVAAASRAFDGLIGSLKKE
jgi:hypothetical protein